MAQTSFFCCLLWPKEWKWKLGRDSSNLTSCFTPERKNLPDVTIWRIYLRFQFSFQRIFFFTSAPDFQAKADEFSCEMALNLARAHTHTHTEPRSSMKGNLTADQFVYNLCHFPEGSLETNTESVHWTMLSFAPFSFLYFSVRKPWFGWIIHFK